MSNLHVGFMDGYLLKEAENPAAVADPTKRDPKHVKWALGVFKSAAASSTWGEAWNKLSPEAQEAAAGELLDQYYAGKLKFDEKTGNWMLFGGGGLAGGGIGAALGGIFGGAKGAAMGGILGVIGGVLFGFLAKHFGWDVKMRDWVATQVVNRNVGAVAETAIAKAEKMPGPAEVKPGQGPETAAATAAGASSTAVGASKASGGLPPPGSAPVSTVPMSGASKPATAPATAVAVNERGVPVEKARPAPLSAPQFTPVQPTGEPAMGVPKPTPTNPEEASAVQAGASGVGATRYTQTNVPATETSPREAAPLPYTNPPAPSAPGGSSTWDQLREQLLAARRQATLPSPIAQR